MPKLVVSPEAQKVMDEMGVGSFYSNPLQSLTVRMLLTSVISIVGLKVFKVEMNAAQVQDYVELVLGLVMVVCILYAR